jgi:hypothetical protein
MPEILFRSTAMADESIHKVEPIPTANYNSAIAKAVEWLGDRYLLAKPINAAPNRATPPMARNSPRSRQGQGQAHR